MQTLGSKSVMFCDSRWVYEIFLNTGMLYLFGACVLKASSPAPQYHIYSWQLASFILPVQVFYPLKNKQTRKHSQNQPTKNQPNPNQPEHYSWEWRSTICWPFASLGERVIPLCVQRLVDRLALSALIATAFAFPPSAADLLQCFFIR